MFSQNSIFKKTFLLIVSVLIGVLVVVSYSITNNQKKGLEDVLYSKANTIVKSLVLTTSDSMVSNDNSFIVEHVQKVLDANQDIKYVVVGKNDEQIIYNNSEKWELLEIEPKIISDLGRTAVVSKILVSKYWDDEVFHLNYPISYSGIQWGWISIGLSIDEYNENIIRIYQDSVVLIISMLITSIFITYILTKWLVTPILLLNNAAKRIADGDLNVKVDITHHDELGELALSFNNMTNALRELDTKQKGYNIELESRVNDRTNELNLLNKELDKRVKNEIGKRRKQEQILINQSRFAAMGEMIGNIAHQWRQPLSVISTAATGTIINIEYNNSNDNEVIKHCQIINKNAQYLSQTIEDFKNYINNDRKMMNFSLTNNIKNLLSLVEATLKTHEINVILDLDENINIDGYPNELIQCMMNIINNAKDAFTGIDEKKYLFIHTCQNKDYLEIIVKDNAGGIPTSIIERIFDPYFTTKHQSQGTGLGLSMTYNMITKGMSGSIIAENMNYEYKNEEYNGAKFTILLPLNKLS
jgi:signal transduction histidine kinase